MPKHMVMDASGHSTLEVNPADKVSIAEAEARFAELVGTKKYLAIKPSGDGSPGTLLKAFDPEADIIFQPSLMGG